MKQNWDWKEIRREFHRIPELGFEEYKTQKKILHYLNCMKKDYMEIQKWKTGVTVLIKGIEPTKKIGFRCDIDGLPIEEKNNLNYKSIHSGKMHACGHDFHITFGLQLVYKLSEERPKDDYTIIFQPAEEGPGGARGLITERKELFKDMDELIAFHIDPTLETGVIGWNEKELFAGAQEFDIKLNANGGHAAIREKVLDLNEIVSKFYLRTLKRNENNKKIFHIGKIESGDARNSFPTSTKIKGTIRSYDTKQVEKEIRYIKKYFESRGIDYTLHLGPYYPPVINDAKRVEKFLEKMGGVTVRVPSRMTGEDFGWYQNVVKTSMFWIGARSSSGLHTDTLNPDENVLKRTQLLFNKF